MNNYQKNQIDDLSVKEMNDGTKLLTVTPILETLYICPGVVIEEKSDAILVRFVRCHMNKKCFIDIKATPDPMNPGSYKIVLPSTDKPIKINYLTETIQIWPQI